MDADLYEVDEHLWIEAQIDALRTGRTDQLDRAHLIEYLTEMTIRDRRELKSRLATLLIHLLKVRFQPDRLPRSWVGTILEQQSELESLLTGIPSLSRHVPELLAQAYDDAARRAARETRLARANFPATCPWTLEEALAFDPPEPR
jgi:uncharacterized protein DUF29